MNHFLTAKQRRVESNEMGRRSFSDYHYAAKRLILAFERERLVTSLTASDFGVFRAKLAKTLGPVALGNEIGRVRSIFKYGYEAGLLEHRSASDRSSASRPSVRFGWLGGPRALECSRPPRSRAC